MNIQFVRCSDDESSDFVFAASLHVKKNIKITTTICTIEELIVKAMEVMTSMYTVGHHARITPQTLPGYVVLDPDPAAPQYLVVQRLLVPSAKNLRKK